jgi:hypothetical protein
MTRNDVDATQVRKAGSITTIRRAQGNVEKLPECMNGKILYGRDGPYQDVVTMFSSCVHCNVAAYKIGHRRECGTKLLPLHSRLRREQMAQDEEVAIDHQLIDAVQENDLPSLGKALDDLGAHINASNAHGASAPLCSLQNIPRHGDALPLFLLSYKDLNVHGLDARGRTASHYLRDQEQFNSGPLFTAQGRCSGRLG